LDALFGSPVELPVVILDYFLRNTGLLDDPKILRKATYEQLERAIRVDALTETYNRRYAYEQLEREVQRALRHDTHLAVLFVDLDDFKQVNDSFGHVAGDEVLRAFGRLLCSLARTEDIVARFGGEEFLVIMPETESAGAYQFGLRALEKLRTEPLVDGIPVTFSAGIAALPEHGKDADTLLELADIGLYHAKYQGKNQVTLMPNEKRASKRYPLSVGLNFHREDLVGEGVSRDLSITGLSLRASARLRKGDTLTVQIEVPHESRVFEVKSKIVWVREIGEDDSVLAGAQYIEPNGARILDEILGRRRGRPHISSM
jgi:diguanylate cyclase (GGDEF)-like protein